ncbi:TRAP-type C4-dicarboxylate transport system substrate-binding protein [Loktanella sp. PT4BL]|jgi:TRAP-type C4-dicarboxylate transport system substrate-binding protein|uniref:TRAP transporter substrate-binding protein n=1 Tax=Loktanella sp. PT4BL TaxID=2135611 RepID=UPI000D75C442|nr:TRAP transporter substrate-binding protein [Loktanella sp. PT4BL]PXW67683.1 TRAP-type C4-dicarboxylate transport system substrate-binding protein [Loktanella sp. PT4BL]
MKTTRTALMSVLAAACLSTAAVAQEVTLRLHQFLPAQANVPAHILDVWADQVEADSDGRIKIDRFPSMQLGGTPPQLIDQAIDGVADIIWTVAGYTPGRFPQLEVFELPFLSPDAEATSRAFWELAETRMMDTDFAAFKPLGLWVHGPGVIHANRPVTDVADLRGLKLRAPTRTTTTLFTELGATAVGMPVPAVPESLSRGVIDGAVIPWEVVPSLKVQELVTNHTEFPGEALYTTAFIFAMNQEAYDNLPADLQAVIDANSGLEFSAFAGRTMQEYDAPGRALAQEAGNTIITLTPAQVADWRAASQPTIDNWIAQADAAGIDGTGLYQEAQALIAKHAAGN